MALAHLSDNAVLRSLVRRCWPKEQHQSARAADAQLRSLVKRGLLKDVSRANVYLCPYCRTWHVGHSSRKQVTP